MGGKEGRRAAAAHPEFGARCAFISSGVRGRMSAALPGLLSAESRGVGPERDRTGLRGWRMHCDDNAFCGGNLACCCGCAGGARFDGAAPDASGRTLWRSAGC